MKNKSIREFCESCNFNLYDAQLKILEKFYNTHIVHDINFKPVTIHEYSEMIAILGRRSGKDWMTAALMLYEISRIPYLHYELSQMPHQKNPVYVLYCSRTSDQIRIFYHVFREFLNKTPLAKKVVTYSYNSITFKLQKLDIVIDFTSSILGYTGGKQVHAMFFNEAGDRQLACALPMFHNNWRQVKTVIMASAWMHKSYLHKLVTTTYPGKLIVQKPTWEVNTEYSKEFLRSSNKFMSDDEFMMEYGSEWISEPENKTISLRISENHIRYLELMASQNPGSKYTDVIRDLIIEFVNKNKTKNIY